MSATQTILFGIRFVCRDRVPCVLATVVGRFLCGGRVYLTVCVLRYCGGRSPAKVFALRAGNSNRAASAELNWLVWYAGGGGWWYGLAEALRCRLKTQGMRVLVAVAVDDGQVFLLLFVWNMLHVRGHAGRSRAHNEKCYVYTVPRRSHSEEGIDVLGI